MNATTKVGLFWCQVLQLLDLPTCVQGSRAWTILCTFPILSKCSTHWLDMHLPKPEAKNSLFVGHVVGGSCWKQGSVSDTLEGADPEAECCNWSSTLRQHAGLASGGLIFRVTMRIPWLFGNVKYGSQNCDVVDSPASMAQTFHVGTGSCPQCSTINLPGHQCSWHSCHLGCEPVNGRSLSVFVSLPLLNFAFK